MQFADFFVVVVLFLMEGEDEVAITESLLFLCAEVRVNLFTFTYFTTAIK